MGREEAERPPWLSSCAGTESRSAPVADLRGPQAGGQGLLCGQAGILGKEDCPARTPKYRAGLRGRRRSGALTATPQRTHSCCSPSFSRSVCHTGNLRQRVLIPSSTPNCRSKHFRLHPVKRKGGARGPSSPDLPVLPRKTGRTRCKAAAGHRPPSTSRTFLILLQAVPLTLSSCSGAGGHPADNSCKGRHPSPPSPDSPTALLCPMEGGKGAKDQASGPGRRWGSKRVTLRIQGRKDRWQG